MTPISSSPEFWDEMRVLVDAIPAGFYALDADRKVVVWNRAMERLTGIPADRAIGLGCCVVCHERPSRSDEECDLFRAGRLENVECVVEGPDGRDVHVLKNGGVLRDAEGRLVGAVETVVDVTALRAAQADIERAQEDLRQLHGFARLVGKNPLMQEVYGLIRQAAASNATVLIMGESGAGKELVAAAIHGESARRDRPFIRVNCSALSESLLESELFGHVRGAFTGAIQDKVGRFEAADGGTLFLDEIGEASHLIQLKLLRVLQEHEFERVGESRTRRVDVRVIAATNKDLRQRMREGLFREDLFYRLSVFPIRLPPLRERKEDIPLLVGHFLEKFNRETGKGIRGLSHDAMRAAMDYCWPGNVRELENAIEHAFVTCEGDEISLFDLPQEIRRAEYRRAECRDAMRARLARVPDRQGLLDLLRECDWNKAEVARRLGVSRAAVWKRMRRLGIPSGPDSAG